MQYILHGKVIFCPDEGAIWNIKDENEKTLLTPSVSRLFVFLLEKRGVAVTREDIFEHVWDHWGKEGSNNSLNNYISQLRKILKHYDISPELIATVPKIGFVIYKDDITTTPVSRGYHHSGAETTNKKKFALIVVSLLLPPVFIFSGYFLNERAANERLKLEPILLEESNKCSIYDLSGNDDVPPSVKGKAVERILKYKNVNCDVNKVVFFQSDRMIYSEGPARFYLAVCNGDYMNFNSCLNYVDTDSKVGK